VLLREQGDCPDGTWGIRTKSYGDVKYFFVFTFQVLSIFRINGLIEGKGFSALTGALPW
jgi:hypothetical protein